MRPIANTSKPRILVVEDDEAFGEMVTTVLERGGFQVLRASDGQTGIDQARQAKPDLVLLDINLPDIDGMQVCAVLKTDAATREIPVIMLTTKGEHSDIILGLQQGADDYVVKPIVPGILLARITAVLRRSTGGLTDEKVLSVGTLRLDMEQRTCTVKEKDIHLLPKEFELLAVLMKRPNKVLTREELLSRVWGYQYFGTTRTLDTTIMRLRKKLGAEGKRIETAQTVGYRFVGE